jgi:hypothetical protein
MTTRAGPRTVRNRSHSILIRAIRLCGRETQPNQYRLQLTQRQLAKELDMSVGNLRYHLDQLGDAVMSRTPLCVQLTLPFDGADWDNPAVRAPVTVERPKLGPDLSLRFTAHPQPETHPTDQPDSRVAETVARLLDSAAELQRSAANLIEHAAELLHNSAQNPAQNTRETREQNRAERAANLARSKTVSKSVFTSSKEEETYLLTDYLPECATNPAQNARETEPETRNSSRTVQPTQSSVTGTNGASPEMALTDTELDALIGPLQQWCARTAAQAVDVNGRQRLRTYPGPTVQAAVRHVLTIVKNPTHGRTVTSPFGLLISVLTKNQLPSPAKSVVEPISRTPAHDDDPEVVAPLWQLALLCANDETFWNQHIAPRTPGPAGRTPTGQTTRTNRIYAALLAHPELVAPAQQHTSATVNPTAGANDPSSTGSTSAQRLIIQQSTDQTTSPMPDHVKGQP